MCHRKHARSPNGSSIMKKVAIITGAGGALGGAVTASFAAAGWDLGLFVHRADEARRLQSAHPEATVVEVDLTDESATRAAAQAVLTAKGRIDAMLGIAGGFAMAKAHEATSADYEHMFDMNVRTLVNSVGAVLPTMLEAGRGLVLGVSAGAAVGGAAGMALYAASKSAVATYLDSVRLETKGTGVRATTLYVMDALDTPANRASMPNVDPAGWINVDQLADTIRSIADSGGRRGQVEIRASGTCPNR